MKYYVWSRIQNEELAWLERFPEEIERKNYLYDKGIPLTEIFPPNLIYPMAIDSGIRIVDNMPNTLGLKIISEKVKTVLEEHSTSECEFLPIKIENHKGRFVKELFYIANFLESVPCLDKDKSEFVIDALDKTQMDHISHLFLDESKIPDDFDLFRLSEMNTLILIREDLKTKLEEAELSGLNFIELDEYGKQYREPDEDEIIARFLASQEQS